MFSKTLYSKKKMHHKIQSQSLHLCPRSLASTSFGSLRQALGNGVQLHGSEILPNWLPDLLKCVIKDKTPLCIYHLYTSYQRKCWPASHVDVEAHKHCEDTLVDSQVSVSPILDHLKYQYNINQDLAKSNVKSFVLLFWGQKQLLVQHFTRWHKHMT